MMNRLSALVGGSQKQAPSLAATPIRASAPPPLLALASGCGSGSQADPLEVRFPSNFHVGLPAGAGATGRGDYAPGTAT